MGDRRYASPKEAFEEVRPLCFDLATHLRKCPLPPEEVAGLMTLVAVHFFGEAMTAAREIADDGRPLAHFARLIMESIIDGLDQKEMH